MKPVSSFDVANKLTFDTVTADLQRLTQMVMSLQTDTLTLNLTDLQICDSAGVALLVEAKRLSQQFQKQMVIVGMSDAVKSLTKFCGVDKMLYNEAS